MSTACGMLDAIVVESTEAGSWTFMVPKIMNPHTVPVPESGVLILSQINNSRDKQEDRALSCNWYWDRWVLEKRPVHYLSRTPALHTTRAIPEGPLAVLVTCFPSFLICLVLLRRPPHGLVLQEGKLVESYLRGLFKYPQ